MKMDTRIVWMYFLPSYFSGICGIDLKPSPIANCVLNNPQTFNCSVSTNWKTVTFTYDKFNRALFSDQGGTCVKFGEYQGFTNDCDYILRKFYLTKQNMVVADQDKIIECEVTYKDVESEGASTAINVQYAPAMSPNVTQTPTGPIIEGNKVVLTCKITGGNPLATILWECDGASPVTPTASLSTTTVTVSVELVVSKNDNGKMCRCIGKHIVWTGSKTTNYIIEVYYKPSSEKPDLKQTPTGPVNESSTATFECEIKGGFPTATITWDCLFATPVESTATPSSDKSTSRRSLIVKKEDNGKMCTCIGNHPAWNTTRNGTLTLSVQYAPKQPPIVKQTPRGPIIEGNTVVLTCEIAGGNPLATMIWECDGSSPPTASTPSNTMTLSVTLNVSMSDNGKTCRCIGNHILWSDSQMTSHILIVYYKPSSERPDLKQIPTGPVNENSTVTVECEIEGGFPTANITWDCLGATTVEPTATPSSDKSISRRSLVLKKEDNDKICTCMGTHPAWTTGRSETLTFSVQYAPEQSPIVNQTPTGPIIEGNVVVLKCEIMGGNPLATIIWECDGSSQTTPTESPPSNTTASSVTLTVSKSDNNKTCRCVGNHILWTGSKMTNHMLIVYYKPTSDRPDLKQTPTGPVNVSSTVTLVCEIDGGFPTATITWDCLGATPVQPTETPTSDKSISKRSLVVKKVDNGKKCTCIGTHPAWTTAQNRTLTFSVQYAPQMSPIVKQTPTGPIFEGNTTVITCEIAGGNPSATITWECDGSSATAPTASPPSNTTTSSVTLTVSKSDNGKICRCIGNHILWAKSQRTNHTLIVYYSPFVNISSRSNLQIVEDANLHLTCNVIDANPPVLKFIWYKDDNVLTSGSNSDYILSKANRKDTGYYKCEASNYIGNNGVDTVHVDILYQPEILQLVVQDGNTVPENDTAVLQCNVSSNPLPTVIWTFETTEEIQKEDKDVLLSNLTIGKTTCFQTGVYNCTASNTIQDGDFSASKTVQLFVNCSPRLYNYSKQPDNQIGLAIGTNLTLKVDVIAYPKPNITWWFTQNGSLEDEQISRTCNRNISLFQHIACVSKLNLTEDDFGEYILSIQNGVGINLLRSFTVKPQGPPVKSSDVNSSCGSLFADVTWKTEYNGGLAQMFHIIVTDKNGDVSIYDTHIDGHRKGRRKKYRLSLKPGFHTFQILGKHSFGNALSEPSSCLVKDTPHQETSSLIGLAAGLGIGVAIIIIVAIILVIFIRRRISKSKDNSTTDQGRINLTACDDDGDGLKDNILYESAGDNFTPQGQAAGVEYAVVNKKDKHALSINKNDTQETALYSIVEKKGNVAGKVVTGTTGKNNRKPKGKIEKKELHTNRKNEDVYENVTKQHVPNKQEKSLNKDGLCYADLVFNPSPTGRKFIIHGLEDRTIYAEVDTTQKIDPLPDSDDGDSNESADLKKGNGKG